MESAIFPEIKTMLRGRRFDNLAEGARSVVESCTTMVQENLPQMGDETWQMCASSRCLF